MDEGGGGGELAGGVSTSSPYPSSASRRGVTDARNSIRRISQEYDMREKIKLESSAGTGHFYTTTKNKRTKPDKLEIKKFDPVARKHVIYKETKIK